MLSLPSAPTSIDALPMRLRVLPALRAPKRVSHKRSWICLCLTIPVPILMAIRQHRRSTTRSSFLDRPSPCFSSRNMMMTIAGLNIAGTDRSERLIPVMDISFEPLDRSINPTRVFSTRPDPQTISTTPTASTEPALIPLCQVEMKMIRSLLWPIKPRRAPRTLSARFSVSTTNERHPSLSH